MQFIPQHKNGKPTMRLVVPVRQGGMRGFCVVSNTQGLPMVNIVMRNLGTIGRILIILGDAADCRHGFNSNNTLQGQIGLVTTLDQYSSTTHYRRATYAKAPAKSSVEIWFAG